jgi:mismatch-specific thymine-DNA glycosylase
MDNFNNYILEDIIPEKMIMLIVGESVGPDSAQNGHYYFNKKNQFWKLLSFVIGKEIDPKDDRSAAKYKIGLTDIIKDKILLQGVDISRLDQYFNLFVKKVETYNPKIIVFNGLFTGGKTKEEKKIRKILKKKIEEFKNKYKNQYIIFQCHSSSGNANAYSEKRELQWIEISKIYKSVLG